MANNADSQGTEPRGQLSADNLPKGALAPLFAALGDITRLDIVNQLLAKSPQPISELTQHSQLTRQAVTRHLKVLAKVNVVQAKKSGREQQYWLQRSALVEAQQYLDGVARQWDSGLDRLQTFLGDN